MPGSWGEQFPELRDYLGPAWYATTVEPPRAWWAAGQDGAPRLLLRVGAASYAASVYVNGQLLGAHEGGHLPFQVELPAGGAPTPLRIAIRVEGLLSPERVPPGALSARPQQFPNVSYDFFPYAGIHRAVALLALPAACVDDVTFVSDVARDCASADVTVRLQARGWARGAADVRLFDEAGAEAAGAGVALGDDGAAVATLRLPKPRLWSPAAPQLYRLRVRLLRADGEDVADEVALDVGVRSVRVEGDALLLNHAPLRLRGFGKHEDAPLSGRGFNAPAAVRDAAALRWCGANSYRTAHYPHSEESLEIADRAGLAVIGETPACYLCFHDAPEAEAARLAGCRRATAELLARDKNRACVLLWSLANEPEANAHLATHGVVVPPPEDEAWKERGRAFFANLFDYARTLDASRPLTLAAHPASDMSWVQLCDVVCTNRYNGWYDLPGRPRDGALKLGKALDAEHAVLRRPFVLSEFGADAIAGTHADPPEMWSEEYQTEMIRAYLDLEHGRPWLIGFHVWNLTDFKTPQAVRRPGGINHKGVFTRERRPKMAAHALRAVWRPAQLAEAKAAGVAVTDDGVIVA